MLPSINMSHLCYNTSQKKTLSKKNYVLTKTNSRTPDFNSRFELQTSVTACDG